jgi:hypothetical protein
MPARLGYGAALVVAAVGGAYLPVVRSASAVTVEVAKKCDVLTQKAYPLRVPGNPAAGHLHGSSKEIQEYFNKCVANGGNVAEPAQDNKTAPKEGSDKGGQGPGGTK